VQSATGTDICIQVIDLVIILNKCSEEQIVGECDIQSRTDKEKSGAVVRIRKRDIVIISRYSEASERLDPVIQSAA